MMLVNNLGSYTQAYPPLLHAEWHGWTPTDLIFPFFLWIVGVAMTFSFARRVEEGGDRGVLIRHTVRRSALIFGLGLLLAGFPYYNLATIRIPGVLQRIALCYLIGSLIFLYTTWRGQAVVIVGVCTAYWMLMTLYPVPGFGPGVLEPIGNFSQYIDWMLLPGHLYRATKVWDPEGVVSTLPAIATLLFGVLVGHLLRSRRELAEKAAWLLATGVLLTVAGYLLGLILPINKKIWTVSFAVFTAGGRGGMEALGDTAGALRVQCDCGLCFERPGGPVVGADGMAATGVRAAVCPARLARIRLSVLRAGACDGALSGGVVSLPAGLDYPSVAGGRGGAHVTKEL